MNYTQQLNPPAKDAQLVYSFRKNENQDQSVYNLEIYSHIWNSQESESNPSFWFATEKDCLQFLSSTNSEEIEKMLK